MAAAATDELGEFYVRYYVGHKGKFGHEFLEFEFRPDGKLRDANNSNYENDTMIRKEFFLTHTALKECRRIITDSEAFLNQELGKVQDSGVELCEAKGGTSSNAGKAAAAGVKSITLDRNAFRIMYSKKALLEEAL